MAEIKIDKGVPIPKVKSGPTTFKSIYPLAEMEIGDSFMPLTANRSSISRIAGAANKKYAPRRFISRKTADGYRIWRVA